jgi:glutamine synthetase
VVELWTPDINGLVKGKWYPLDSFAQQAEGLVTFPNALLSWTRDALMYDDIPYSNPQTGFPDLAVRPDLTSIRAMSWYDSHAAVLGHIRTLWGDPIPVDPRQVLIEQVAALTEQGVEPQCSLEYEFSLLEPDGTATNQRHEGYDFVLPKKVARFLDALVTQLVEFGLPVAVGHTEWGFGQMEVTLRPLPALLAADYSVMLKAAVKSIAHSMDLVASFMAKPFADQPGNGLHINTSLWDSQGSNLFADSGRNSELVRRFLGGTVTASQEFSLLGAPTVNAYKRRTGGGMAPATVTWSQTSKTAAVRALFDRGPASRIEFRAAGADCNPYIGLAGVLAQGLHGLRADLSPPPELVGSAYSVNDPGLRLPTTLLDAVHLFERSSVVRQSLGDEFVDHYATLVRHELTDFNAAVTDWELQRYLRYS